MTQTLIDAAFAALQQQNTAGFIEICHAAFSDAQTSEDDLAWLAGNSIQARIEPALQYVHAFMDRFPDSLHPISVLYGGMLLDGALPSKNRFDEASHIARLYLRRVKDAGLLQSDRPEIQDGVAKAFLHLTAVYTEAGARSYSVRVLELGMQLIAVPYWQEVYRAEIAALKKELQEDAALATRDVEWEQFFTTYSNVSQLHEQSVQAGFETLAYRLSALESQLRFGTISVPLTFAEEVWLVLFGNPEQGMGLR